MPVSSYENLKILEDLADAFILLNDSFEPVWLNSSAQALGEHSAAGEDTNEFFRSLGNQLHELQETSGDERPNRLDQYHGENRERFVEWTLESAQQGALDGEHLLIGRDVSKIQYELQQAKSQLKHLSTIINSEPACVKTIGRNGELIDMNPAGLKLIGATDLESVKGASIYDLLESTSLEKYKDFNRRVFRGESGSLDFEIRTLDGQKRHMRTYASPLKDDNGKVVMHVAVTNDVTAEIRSNLQLRESMEKVQAAAIAKGQFLANMSHEIRTPMNAVLGLSDLLLDTNLDQDQRKFAEGIHSSANSLLKLINDILDFSKIQAGKLEINPRPSSLRMELSSLKQMFSTQAEKKGIDLLLEVSPRVPDSVVIDPDRFKQVLINLLGNAIKFTEVGKVGARVDFDDQSPTGSDKIVLEVFDTGIGISQENRDKIFESFTQGDAGFNRDYGGTGLGLSISNQLIGLMNGNLEMKSELGEGTSFWITIPVIASPDTHPAPQSRGPRTIEAREKGKRLSILLAEDNHFNRAYAARILEKAGHQVTVAANGREAIAAVENGAFDLVLMDIQMPEMDGEEATLTIRSNDQYTALPIVALTANAMNDAKERFLKNGMNAVLSKPFSKEELLQLVDEIADQVRQTG